MKKINYILMAAIILLGFIACDQNDTEGAIYNAANNEVSFPKASGSYTFGAVDPDEYGIRLQRGNAVGAVSIPLTVTDASGLFSVPTEASFADGAYETTVKVTFNRNNLVVAKDYPIKIMIPDNPIKERIVSYTLTITRDYVWNHFATGEFDSQSFEEKWAQEILKADGAETYKLPSVYETGYDLIFTVAADQSIALLAPTMTSGGATLYKFTTGVTHPTYGMMYLGVDPGSDGAGGFWSYFDKDGHEAVFNGLLHVGAGSFGWYDETLTW
jgi:hypothetical protein